MNLPFGYKWPEPPTWPEPGLMRIKMLRTCYGSENGLHAKEYIKGEIYHVGVILGRVFVEASEAVEVNEEKMVCSAPENKMIKPKHNKKKKIESVPEK